MQDDHRPQVLNRRREPQRADEPRTALRGLDGGAPDAEHADHRDRQCDQHADDRERPDVERPERERAEHGRGRGDDPGEDVEQRPRDERDADRAGEQPAPAPTRGDERTPPHRDHGRPTRRDSGRDPARDIRAGDVGNSLGDQEPRERTPDKADHRHASELPVGGGPQDDQRSAGASRMWFTSAGSSASGPPRDPDRSPSMIATAITSPTIAGPLSRSWSTVPGLSGVSPTIAADVKSVPSETIAAM